MGFDSRPSRHSRPARLLDGRFRLTNVRYMLGLLSAVCSSYRERLERRTVSDSCKSSRVHASSRTWLSRARESRYSLRPGMITGVQPRPFLFVIHDCSTGLTDSKRPGSAYCELPEAWWHKSATAGDTSAFYIAHCESHRRSRGEGILCPRCAAS
jgi:hypothetical protein